MSLGTPGTFRSRKEACCEYRGTVNAPALVAILARDALDALEGGDVAVVKELLGDLVEHGEKMVKYFRRLAREGTELTTPWTDYSNEGRT